MLIFNSIKAEQVLDFLATPRGGGCVYFQGAIAIWNASSACCIQSKEKTGSQSHMRALLCNTSSTHNNTHEQRLPLSWMGPPRSRRSSVTQTYKNTNGYIKKWRHWEKCARATQQVFLWAHNGTVAVFSASYKYVTFPYFFPLLFCTLAQCELKIDHARAFVVLFPGLRVHVRIRSIHLWIGGGDASKKWLADHSAKLNFMKYRSIQHGWESRHYYKSNHPGSRKIDEIKCWK